MPINPAPRRRAGDAYINQSNFNIAARCEKGSELAAKLASITHSARTRGDAWTAAAHAKSGGVTPPLLLVLTRAVGDVSSSPLRSASVQGPRASAPKRRAWKRPARPRGSTYSAFRH